MPHYTGPHYGVRNPNFKFHCTEEVRRERCLTAIVYSHLLNMAGENITTKLKEQLKELNKN